MESRKLAVSGKIKHYVVDNDNVVTPLIHNNRDIVTFTGNSRFKHRSRGYFESPMNDILTLILVNKLPWINMVIVIRN